VTDKPKSPETGIKPLDEVVRKGGASEKPPAGKPPQNMQPGTTKPDSKPAKK
jgi:hypothetical protein